MRLSGLQNCPAYTFTAAIGPLSRRQRVYAKSRGVSPCRIIQPNLLPVGIRNQRLRRYIHIALPAGSRIANVQQRMARGVILRLLDIHHAAPTNQLLVTRRSISARAV